MNFLFSNNQHLIRHHVLLQLIKHHDLSLFHNFLLLLHYDNFGKQINRLKLQLKLGQYLELLIIDRYFFLEHLHIHLIEIYYMFFFKSNHILYKDNQFKMKFHDLFNIRMHNPSILHLILHFRNQ